MLLAISCHGKRHGGVGGSSAAQPGTVTASGGAQASTTGGHGTSGMGLAGAAGGAKRNFTPFDWNLLTIFCHALSASVEKILLMHEEQLNQTRIETVFARCAELFSERNHQVLFTVMGEFTGQLFSFEGASVLLMDQQSGMLYQLSRGEDEEGRVYAKNVHRLPANLGITGICVKN